MRPVRDVVRRVAPALVVALLAAACGSASGAGPRAATVVGPGVVVFPVGQRQRAPRLTGTTLSGRRLTVASLLGHGVVAVNVWASWCGPCRREMPLLARADGRSLHMVGIDEEDRSPAARRFAVSLGARYPSLDDPDGRLLHSLPMLPQSGVPSTVFIDDHGRIAARVIGPIDERSLRLVLSKVGES